MGLSVIVEFPVADLPDDGEDEREGSSRKPDGREDRYGMTRTGKRSCRTSATGTDPTTWW